MSCGPKELCDHLRANDPSITGLSLPIYDQSRLRKVLKALMRSCSTLNRLVLNVEWEVEAALEMATWFRQPGESSLHELCFQAYYR
jgi:hypothetical protein